SNPRHPRNENDPKPIGGLADRARDATRRSMGRRSMPPGPEVLEVEETGFGSLRKAEAFRYRLFSLLQGADRGEGFGAGGFEPPNGRSKVSWLTTCRRPIPGGGSPIGARSRGRDSGRSD